MGLLDKLRAVTLLGSAKPSRVEPQPASPGDGKPKAFRSRTAVHEDDSESPKSRQEVGNGSLVAPATPTRPPPSPLGRSLTATGLKFDAASGLWVKAAPASPASPVALAGGGTPVRAALPPIPAPEVTAPTDKPVHLLEALLYLLEPLVGSAGGKKAKTDKKELGTLTLALLVRVVEAANERVVQRHGEPKEERRAPMTSVQQQTAARRAKQLVQSLQTSQNSTEKDTAVLDLAKLAEGEVSAARGRVRRPREELARAAAAPPASRPGAP
jgi:hypothetical protein